jgi:hypothetical protein
MVRALTGFFYDWKFALLAVAFAPALLMVYVYHNDVNFWMHPFWTRHVETPHLVYYFRPIGALLIDIQTNLIRLVPSLLILNFVRFLALLMVVASAKIVNKFIEDNLEVKPAVRRMLIVATFLQPTWFIVVAWLHSFMPAVLTHLLSLWASWIFFSSLGKGNLPRVRPAAAAGVLMTIAVLIYPPGACGFFWLPLTALMFGRDRRAMKFALSSTVFFGICGVVSLAVHRFILKDLLCGSWTQCYTGFEATSREYSLVLATSLLEKFFVLMDVISMHGASWLMLIEGLLFDPLFVGPILLIGLFIIAPKFKSGKLAGLDFRAMAYNFGVLTAFALIFNAPNLVTTGNVVVYRSTCVNSLLFGIALANLLGFVKNKKFQKVAVAAMATLLTFSSMIIGYQRLNRWAGEWHNAFNYPGTEEICQRGPEAYDQLMMMPWTLTASRIRPIDPYLRDFDLPVLPIGSLATLCRLR